MRAVFNLLAAGFVLAAIYLAAAEPAHRAAAQSKATSPKSIGKPAAKPAEEVAPTPAPEGATSGKYSADEAAIRQTGVAFTEAFSAADVQGVADLFTADAEYVDEQGNAIQGRPAIEEWLTTFFAKNPDCPLEMNIDSLRFVSPGVAIEDGTTTVTRPGDAAAHHCRYTAVHVKTGKKWLTASVRDQVLQGARQHGEELQQLGWLVGDWVDEEDDSIVTFSCEFVDEGHFLLRKFNVKIAGEDTQSGTQRIGWDAQAGKLRAWTFDSDGGYAEGVWHHDGENWVFKSTGVTATGKTASATQIYTFVNDHTLTWQAVDSEIDGERLPDSESFTLVRASPQPKSADGAADHE